MTDLLAAIFARGGSKGLPGKNTKLFYGKPLIEWAIRQASSIPDIGDVYVSTDDCEIAKIATKAGAKLPFLRPQALANDDSPEWEAWQHFLQFIKKRDGRLPERLVILPTTSPLRSDEDIKKAISVSRLEGVDVVFAVTEAKHSPAFNMITVSDRGSPFLLQSVDSQSVFRRQDAPTCYNITTSVYVVRTQFVLSSRGLFDAGENARVVKVPACRAVDIDDALDFKIAEFLFAGERV